MRLEFIMIVLGFVLIIAAVAASVILIAQNAGSLDVHALGHVRSLNAYWLVVAGLAAMAVAVIGLAIVRQAGVRTHRSRRKVVPTAADQRPMTTPENSTAAPESTERPAKRSLFGRRSSGAS